jgi:hypothetical protein
MKQFEETGSVCFVSVRWDVTSFVFDLHKCYNLRGHHVENILV